MTIGLGDTSTGTGCVSLNSDGSLPVGPLPPGVSYCADAAAVMQQSTLNAIYQNTLTPAVVTGPVASGMSTTTIMLAAGAAVLLLLMMRR